MDPSMDPTKTPAAPPPPGVIPNLINPLNDQRVSIAVCSVMLSLIFIFSSGRAINVYLNRTVGLDDCKRLPLSFISEKY